MKIDKKIIQELSNYLKEEIEKINQKIQEYL